MEKLIGRDEEKKILDEALASGEPELIALFGRRRVGKTFLIRQHLKSHLVFEFVGTRDASMAKQLGNFKIALDLASGAGNLYQVAANWADAFQQLNHYLAPKCKEGKVVIFLDEFPWLNTHKSGFLSAFDHWWNSWGNRQTNLIVVICGSAASWMIQHIVNARGGLHNRITRKIRLLPFNLNEAEQYLSARKVNLDRYQLLQLYMIMGGVPHYLKEIKKGESSAQAVNRIFFSKNALLNDEFKNLYHSLFDDATRHLAVARALASNNAGLTRTGIIDAAGLSSGGTITNILDDLIESGFVTAWHPYDKRSRDSIYKLSDEFTHFYFKFMERNRSHGKDIWQGYSTGQSWRSWSGVAFERVCLKHIAQLKVALGIAAVHTEESAWRHLPKKGKGAQIDLLIDRRDFVINLCEMKFSESEFVIDKAYAAALQNKRDVFKAETGTKKSIFLTLVTSFGVKENDKYLELIQNSITMDALWQ